LSEQALLSITAVHSILNLICNYLLWEFTLCYKPTCVNFQQTSSQLHQRMGQQVWDPGEPEFPKLATGGNHMRRGNKLPNLKMN